MFARPRFVVAVMLVLATCGVWVSMAQAAPQPGAVCKVVGRERNSGSGMLRCTQTPSRGLRWRLVTTSGGSATATTTTTTTTVVTTTTTPRGAVAAPVLVGGNPASCEPIQLSWSGANPDTGWYSVQWVTASSSNFNNYTMFNVRGTSVTLPNWFVGGTSYRFRVYAMRADWDGVWHRNENVTPQSNMIEIAVPVCIPTGGGDAPLSCAAGGTCVVGDTGPGGGIVFYVHPGGGTFACGVALTSTCRYLEAAPTSGTNAWTEAGYVWSGNTATAIGATARGTAIGTGLRNTEAIVNQAGGGSTASRAGTITRAYRGPNNLTDWYLPSQAELNELCKYARNTGQTVGAATVCTGGSSSTARGFVDNRYWSSTEDGADIAWNQDFTDGGQFNGEKSRTRSVRPIRAFGGTLACADGATCAVGDTGPGGGIVFYVHPGGGTFACGVALTSTCRYLEAATADQTAGLGQVWATNAAACYADASDSATSDCQSNSVYSNTAGQAASRTASEAIGRGMSNTARIYSQLTGIGAATAADYAAGIAWTYTNNGLTDWYLPSKDELNELFLQRARVGAFKDDTYWSSSEGSRTAAWRQNFTLSNRFTVNKDDPSHVRPIRAFGGTLACADGATCAVGDTGPGGGIVFYVAATPFTSTGSDCGTNCRYLEAATTDQSTAISWCNDTLTGLGVTATALGSGMGNTTTADATCTSGAIQLAADYTNNGKTDWHLPSQAELNQLYLQQGAVGGFAAAVYWSSSERFTFSAWSQWFTSGVQPDNNKGLAIRVRVVRAF